MAIAISVDATLQVNRNVDDPTISITPVTGDTMLLLGVYIDQTGEGDISSISDDQGNTWVLGVTQLNASRRCAIYYVENPAIASTTITVNTTASCDTIIDAFTITGSKATSPIGNNAVSNGASTAIATTINVGTANSMIVWFSGMTNNSTYGTYGSGQVERGQGANGGAEKFAGVMTSELLAPTGNDTQSATASKSAGYVANALEILEEPSTGFAYVQGVLI
ncbi:hypothetical protein ES702_02818 [subsurface metagenome]